MIIHAKSSNMHWYFGKMKLDNIRRTLFQVFCHCGTVNNFSKFLRKITESDTFKQKVTHLNSYDSPLPGVPNMC